jgi:hypothetical protein
LCGAGHRADPLPVSVGISRTQLCLRSSRPKDASGDHIILACRRGGATHSQPARSRRIRGLAGPRCQHREGEGDGRPE